MENKKLEGLSTQDLTVLLTMALSKVMDWMPEENRSKAICIPDPRDPTKLCAVHNGPEGLTILMGDGFQGFCEELLCEECVASLVPFSVIFTGFNLETGEFDPEAFIGLYGAHDEDQNQIKQDDDIPEIHIYPNDPSKKRTLN